MFKPLHDSMNQKLFEKNIYNQSSHYENYRQFAMWMEAIIVYHKLTLFVVNKDE